MRTATGGSRKGVTSARVAPRGRPSEALAARIVGWLDEAKAEDIITIDLHGKSSMSDFMIIASGRSDRHVGAIAEQLAKKLREEGWSRVKIEGQPQCDWVLIDAGDVIVHVFRPEVREFYNLEKMWSLERTPESSAH
jgi:ribosome-associated protein